MSRALANTVAPVTAEKLIEEEEMEATEAISQSGASLNMRVIQDIMLNQFTAGHGKGLEWAEEVAKEMDSVPGRLGDPFMAEVIVQEAANEVMQQVAENKMGALLGDSPEMEEQLSQISELNHKTEDAEPETNKKAGRVRRLKAMKKASKVVVTDKLEKAKGLVQKAKYKTSQEKELMKELGQKMKREKYPAVAPRLGPTNESGERRWQHLKRKIKEGAEQESSLDTKKNKEKAVMPAKVPIDTEKEVTIETEQKESHDPSKTIKKAVSGQESASKDLAIVQEPEKKASALKPGKAKQKPKSKSDTNIKSHAVVSDIINSKALKEKIRKEVYELLKSSISFTAPKRIAATPMAVSVTVRTMILAKGVQKTKPASKLRMITKSKKTRMFDMVPPSGKVDKPTEPTIKHMVPMGADPESLFSLEKDDSSAMMCTKVLQGSCTTDLAVKAWKLFEERALGYGDMVCDSEGRQHQEICPMCAFCSLKMEQCKTKTNLKRVRCGTNVSFEKFINPTIKSQNMKSENKVKVLKKGRFYGLKLYAEMGPDFWCSELQYHGCFGPHVNKWLKKEYAYFQEGDYPDKVCDSEHNQHQSYCLFKYHQCHQRKFHDTKVYRVGCMKDKEYKMVDGGYEQVKVFHRHISLKALQRDRANNDAETF
ncbi:uncharacterized protein LOC144766832 [Lissotriton helveticus]